MLFDTDVGGAKYEIQKSLRFRASASAYLSRTPTVAGNRKTWTWSGWVKRGIINGSANLQLFSATGTTFDNAIHFTGGGTNDLLRLQLDGNNAGVVPTAGVSRDPSAWYHIIISVDTTQATAANRVLIYVNGAGVVYGSATYPTQNYDTMFNSTNAHNIGRSATGSNQYFDGYLSEINFIDGQALDPSYFGQVSAETGAWIPKKYTGTYGTNGFYLPFNDGSTLGNLTADRSGNGNNWTANNFSLTSGVTYDWMDDTPTNNFAVLNPIGSYPGAIRAGNLTTNVAGINTNANSSIGVSSGKWYWEVNGNTPGCNGIVNTAFPFWYAWIPGQDANSVGYFSGGSKYENGSHTAYGAAYGSADIIGMALDMDAGTLTCYKNGVSQGVLKSGLSGTWFPSIGANDVNTQHANFGQRPFAYSPPAGFKALCTKNLPTPSILNPKKHFDIVLATGANIKSTAEAVFPGNFLEWIKDRGNANNHQLIDTVRGTSAVLQSNTTGAETTYSAPSGSSVGWTWKTGGAPVTNNDGSIQSQVSANQQAGFSIVTYTGTGANATVGHGLGVAPKMVIIKGRTGTANDWAVWHSSLTATEALFLNLTLAKQTGVSAWNSTLPSSTVFSLGVSSTVNTNTNTYVAYCFAEIPGYSKIGSYAGNGSTDGSFIHCGFRPRFVMYKRIDSSGNWYIEDAARNPYNVVNISLSPNLSSVDYNGGGNEIDFLANGFKFRTASAEQNTLNGTYIFYAVAEQPFQFANAR